jgi:hypothetical protein
MHRTELLLTLIVICLVPALRAQTTAPKPDPEMKKLDVLVGHWTYEGEYEPGPLGLVGKVKGVWDARMILGGFFLYEDVNEKVGTGESHALGIESYNPASKQFITNWYQSDGSRYSGTLTITGNTVVWTGPMEFAGKHYQFREIFACAPDFMSGTSKREFSTDGQRWTPFWEAKFVKAKPAATKN